MWLLVCHHHTLTANVIVNFHTNGMKIYFGISISYTFTFDI